MGILLRRPVATAIIAAIAITGCGAPSFRMRIAQPEGAELVVLGGPFSADRTLAIPFVTRFQPMGEWQAYEVRLRVPASVATRLGGRGEVELPGALYVYAATEVARGGVADLPLDEERLGRLLRGQSAEAEWWVSDPNVIDGRLAHLTLHGAR